MMGQVEMGAFSTAVELYFEDGLEECEPQAFDVRVVVSHRWFCY